MSGFKWWGTEIFKQVSSENVISPSISRSKSNCMEFNHSKILLLHILLPASPDSYGNPENTSSTLPTFRKKTDKIGMKTHRAATGALVPTRPWPQANVSVVEYGEQCTPSFTYLTQLNLAVHPWVDLQHKIHQIAREVLIAVNFNLDILFDFNPHILDVCITIYEWMNECSFGFRLIHDLLRMRGYNKKQNPSVETFTK